MGRRYLKSDQRLCEESSVDCEIKGEAVVVIRKRKKIKKDQLTFTSNLVVVLVIFKSFFS